jgi:ubiquinone/menaquinone biosynthesis C-methylase UbiE
MIENIYWLNLRELPYFRAILRAVEGRLVREVELPGPVLDLGCGDGHFVSVTYEDKLDVGLDPSMGPMREAQARAAYHNLIQADGAGMPFKSESFSSALSNSVLEHIPHLDNVLFELARVLKPEAPFVFTVPNPAYAEELSVACLLDSIKLHRLASAYRNWFNRMSRTVNLLDEGKWRRKLENVGLEIVETKRYFSVSALRTLEWGHYFGAPCLLARWLTGRWIIAPKKWNLWLTELLTRRYAEEAPTNEGTYNFYLARKR